MFGGRLQHTIFYHAPQKYVYLIVGLFTYFGGFLTYFGMA
jgi:hypothetical protein